MNLLLQLVMFRTPVQLIDRYMYLFLEIKLQRTEYHLFTCKPQHLLIKTNLYIEPLKLPTTMDSINPIDTSQSSKHSLIIDIRNTLLLLYIKIHCPVIFYLQYQPYQTLYRAGAQ